MQLLETVLFQAAHEGCMPPADCLPRPIAEEALKCFATVGRLGTAALALIDLPMAQCSDTETGGRERHVARTRVTDRGPEGKGAVMAAKVEASAARQANTLSQQLARGLEQQVAALTRELAMSEQRAQVLGSTRF
jgi:hypothetical protein